jgi:osmotically inducible protein OsmC
MPTRKAEAEWKGKLAEGSGRLKDGSGAFDGTYSFKSDLKKANRPPIRKS